MIEILYCPINNELLLFTGAFEIDIQKNTMVIYVYGGKRRDIRLLDSSKLVHIGWL